MSSPPQCGWCSRNLENLKVIQSSLSEKYRIVGLTMSDDDIEKYLMENHLYFPVFKNPSEDSKLSLRLGGTPQTIVISTDGKIIKNWRGAYSSNQKQDIENFFNASFPELKLAKQ